ncbi:MAG: hypothetical protein JSU01_02165 [Bacteroidetes bacterium]|nr:hypothetical protein [Bacteroidota bacterium]
MKAYADNNQPYGIRLYMDLIYAVYAGLAGILIAFLISLVLSIKHKWFWLNSLFVLLAGLGSFLVDRFYWKHVKFIFMSPGLLFKSDWWFNFIGSIFMLVIGLCLFFSKRIIRFLNGRNTQATVNPSLIV